MKLSELEHGLNVALLLAMIQFNARSVLGVPNTLAYLFSE